VLENKVLGIFGPEGEKRQKNGENCVMRIFIICTSCQILGWSNHGGWAVWGI